MLSSQCYSSVGLVLCISKKERKTGEGERREGEGRAANPFSIAEVCLLTTVIWGINKRS